MLWCVIFLNIPLVLAIALRHLAYRGHEGLLTSLGLSPDVRRVYLQKDE